MGSHPRSRTPVAPKATTNYGAISMMQEHDPGVPVKVSYTEKSGHSMKEGYQAVWVATLQDPTPENIARIVWLRTGSTNLKSTDPAVHMAKVMLNKDRVIILYIPEYKKFTFRYFKNIGVTVKLI